MEASEPLKTLVDWMLENGYGGLASVMFLAGSVAPIPWELVLLPAGALGLEPLSAGLAGGLGASLGAVVGYIIGFVAGRPLALRLGRYLMVSESNIQQVEEWFSRWGDAATLITRGVQYMPYKTFSLAAGVLRVNFVRYIIFTVLGTVIRCWYMVYLGNVAVISYGFLGFVALMFFLGYALPRLIKVVMGH